MKIKELVEQIQLNEDWGNLNGLEPWIRDEIDTLHHVNKNRAYDRFQPATMGQNSQLKVIANLKGTVFNNFLNNSRDYAGVVIRASSQQIAAIFQRGNGNNFVILNAKRLKFVIDDYYDKHPDALIDTSYAKKTPERIKNDKLIEVAYGLQLHKRGKTYYDPYVEVAIPTANMKNSEVKEFIKRLTTLILGSGEQLSFLSVTVDKERFAAAKTRIHGQHNLPSDVLGPFNPGEYGKATTYDSTGKESRVSWNNAVRRDLARRLEKFKAQKATQTKTPQEFFDLIQKTGYMQKINIGGYVYELKAHDIRMSGIIGVAHPESYPKSNPGNYIEYVYNSTISPQTQQQNDIKAIIDPLYNTWSNHPEKTKEEKAQKDAAYKVYMDKKAELRLQMPPRSFKITFKIQGANIVPDKLLASPDRIYI